MWTQQLCSTGLVAPQHVKSSQSRNWTSVPCIGRLFSTNGLPRKSWIVILWSTVKKKKKVHFSFWDKCLLSVFLFIMCSSYLVISSWQQFFLPFSIQSFADLRNRCIFFRANGTWILLLFLIYCFFSTPANVHSSWIKFLITVDKSSLLLWHQ